MGPVRRISVMVPMRDEIAHVRGLVEDLAGQDYDGGLEVLVADGGSRDGSPAALAEVARQHDLDLRILPNPAGWVSPGLNACIAEATGDLLVRLDCHSRYPADYLRRCAELAESTGAWNVGGQVVPVGETAMERAVACAMNSPFGGIGWTQAATASEPVEVDTVTFGAFRPEAFDQAGGFDETLVRNQDDEFNLRLRRAGGRIVLDPTIVVRYRPRGTLAGVWRQYREYGLWKIPVMRKHQRVLSARSMAPAALVLSLALGAAAAPWSRTARMALLAELGVYGAGASLFAVIGARRERGSLALAPLVVVVFPAFHLAYGVGMVHGCLKALRAG